MLCALNPTLVHSFWGFSQKNPLKQIVVFEDFVWTLVRFFLINLTFIFQGKKSQKVSPFDSCVAEA